MSLAASTATPSATQIADRLRAQRLDGAVVAAPHGTAPASAPIVFRFSSFGGFPVEPVAQSPHDPSAVYARFSLGA